MARVGARARAERCFARGFSQRSWVAGLSPPLSRGDGAVGGTDRARPTRRYRAKRTPSDSVVFLCLPRARRLSSLACRAPTRRTMRMTFAPSIRALKILQQELAGCTACPKMIGPVVHGPAIPSRIFILGQAPGPREGGLGRPFAWTAGRTLFRWLEEATGANETQIRARIYFAAVARCFPGKAKSGGDRKPDPDEIQRCLRFVAGEVEILRPKLVIPVGSLAIEQVLGHKGPLTAIIGMQHRVRYHGHDTDVTCVASSKRYCRAGIRPEPGRTLLARALKLIAKHPQTQHLATASED